MPSTEMARAFAAQLKSTTGTGPERCRVFINENVVTLICDRTMTPAEKTLVGGDPDVVSELRRKLQEQVIERFIPEVERITGRRVVGSMTGHCLPLDTASYVFLLDGAMGNGKVS